MLARNIELRGQCERGDDYTRKLMQGFRNRTGTLAERAEVFVMPVGIVGNNGSSPPGEAPAEAERACVRPKAGEVVRGQRCFAGRSSHVMKEAEEACEMNQLDPETVADEDRPHE